MTPLENLARIAARPRPTGAQAEAAGYDCGLSGATPANCHFSFFEMPELTRAWERGQERGKTDRPCAI